LRKIRTTFERRLLNDWRGNNPPNYIKMGFKKTETIIFIAFLMLFYGLIGMGIIEGIYHYYLPLCNLITWGGLILTLLLMIKPVFLIIKEFIWEDKTKEQILR